MAHTATPTGAIRPTSPIPTCEVLQGILIELEAAAELVEQLLVNGPDSSVVATLVQSLDEMTGLLKGDR